MKNHRPTWGAKLEIHMKPSRMAALATASITLSLYMALAPAAAAGSPVADRQAAMKLIAQSMKAAFGYASGQTPFDAAKVKSTLDQVASSSNTLHKLFPAGSGTDPKSAADPKVWANKADFDKRLTEMSTLAVAASKTTSPQALKPALSALGANCKACHDIYRMKAPT